MKCEVGMQGKIVGGRRRVSESLRRKEEAKKDAAQRGAMTYLSWAKSCCLMRLLFGYLGRAGPVCTKNMV